MTCLQHVLPLKDSSAIINRKFIAIYPCSIVPITRTDEYLRRFGPRSVKSNPVRSKTASTVCGTLATADENTLSFNCVPAEEIWGAQCGNRISARVTGLQPSSEEGSSDSIHDTERSTPAICASCRNCFGGRINSAVKHMEG